MTLTCAWCGREFGRPHVKGPAPRYCSVGHRQRAYEDRRYRREVGIRAETTLDLKADIARLRAEIEEMRSHARGHGDSCISCLLIGEGD